MRKQDFDVRVFEEAAKRFRRHYREQTPQPEKPGVSPFLLNPLVWLLMIVFIAAAWLSAYRTSSVFAAISEHVIEGYLAIIVIEGVAGGLALFQVIEDYKRSGVVPKSGKVSNFILTILFLAIGLGLITNVYSILIAQNVHYAELDWTVFILAGSIATLTLAIIGHTIGVLWVLSREDTKDARQTYRDEMSVWETEYQEAWHDPRTQKFWVGMVQNVLDEKQSLSVQGRPVDAVQSSSGAGFARLANVQRERNEQRPVNTGGRNTTEQVADILRTIDDLDQWSYSQLLARDDIGSLTSSKGTLSNAKRLLDGE